MEWSELIGAGEWSGVKWNNMEWRGVDWSRLCGVDWTGLDWIEQGAGLDRCGIGVWVFLGGDPLTLRMLHLGH